LGVKKLISDPSFLALLGVNVYSMYYYFNHPEIFTTLIWLYWAQSVMLGLFNFLDLLTIGNKGVNPLTNSSGEKVNWGTAGLAFFFFFHYGFFHLVYFIFLFSLKKSGPFNYEFFKIFLLLFLGSQIINFVQHKIQNRKIPPDIGKKFFLPYLRILPMHLCILIPAFLGWGNLQIFVILKVVADLLAYIITSPRYTKKEKPFPVLQSQITNTKSS
jgi:hypothetical protein